MNDYVSKEELKEFFEGITIVAGERKRAAAAAISEVLKAVYNGVMELATTDAVPVIRCKDCKHRDWDVVDIPYGLTKHIEWCSIRYNADGENIMVSPNGFCSEAESKVSSNFE